MVRCSLALSLLSIMLLTGCMVCGLDQFEWVKDSSHQTVPFAPRAHFSRNTQEAFLVIVWILNDTLPHDLMLTLDQTQQPNSEPFESIVIESLQIEYTGESPVDLVSAEMPLDQRTHQITEKSISFEGAVTRRDSFILSLRGYAIDKQGQRHPFEKWDAYQFKERKWHWGPMTV